MSKNILVGITSSIASYKTYELIRMYKKAGFNVKTVLSENALNFVSPLTFETLTNEKCYYQQYGEKTDIEHVQLVDWADVFVVAPLSANSISKFASGICDNLLTSIFCAYLGSKKPVLLAPAMNTDMLNNPIIQMNLDILETYCDIAPCEKGFLACGKDGDGRLCNIEIIFQKTMRLLFQNKENNSKRVVVTIGGTKEAIDNVRYISNLSSGRMGIALSDWAYYKGYDVVGVTTVPATDRAYKTIDVLTARDMLSVLKKTEFDYLLMAAAVGDFRAEKISNKKIEKASIKDNLEVKMVKNPDIVATIAKNKKENQVIIGFCLGDVDLLENAKRKLEEKNLDYIVANDINTALNTEENKVTIIKKDGTIYDIDLDIKENVARKIIEVCL